MRQSGDTCLYTSFAHAVRLRVASACVLLCSVQFPNILWALIFTKKKKNIQIAQKETVIQPQRWKYCSCPPELAVSVWTVGYTCQSLLYDIGLKDLSLSPSAMCKSWRLWNTSIPLSPGWALWLWNGSFWRAHTEQLLQKGCFSFLWIMHILLPLSTAPLYVRDRFSLQGVMQHCNPITSLINMPGCMLRLMN